MAGRCRSVLNSSVGHRKAKRLKSISSQFLLFLLFLISIFFLNSEDISGSPQLSVLATFMSTWIYIPRKFENRTRGEFILSIKNTRPPCLVLAGTVMQPLLRYQRRTSSNSSYCLWEQNLKFPGGGRKRENDLNHVSSQLFQELSNYYVSVENTSRIPPFLLHKSELVYGEAFKNMVFHPKLFSSFIVKRNVSTIGSSFISEVKLKDKNKQVRIEANAASSNSTPIVIDTGATFGTTPFIEDLIPGTVEKVEGAVRNLSGNSNITARGFGRWNVKDINGVSTVIEPFLQVVPKSEVRLMSPQDYFQGLNGGNYLVTKDSSWLTLPNGIKMEVPFHHSNRLPMLFEPARTDLSIHYLNFDDLDTSKIHFNVADEKNQNLTESEKEFLHKHRLLSHMNHSWVRELMQDRRFIDQNGKTVEMDPVLKVKHKGTKTCRFDKIKCAGCLLGKMKRRTDSSSVTTNVNEMALKEGSLFPGQTIHSDQYESSVGGRRIETYGREQELDKYKGGTIFCDAMSSYVFINHQESLQTGDTLRGKHAFEDHAEQMGVNILGYRADNHIFNSKSYQADCEQQNQKMNYCGVGAHHQNGVAERTIQTITSWARTLLIDAAIHWPDEIDLDLWPLAMNHAVYIWNNTPKQGVGFSPLELFSGVRSNHSHVLALSSTSVQRRAPLMSCSFFAVVVSLASLALTLSRFPPAHRL